MKVHNLHIITNTAIAKIGNWNLDTSKARASIQLDYATKELELKARTNSNVIYFMAVDGEVMYVGRTTQVLVKRMGGYRNPRATQATNVRMNEFLRTALEAGRKVELYATVAEVSVVSPLTGATFTGQRALNTLEELFIMEINPALNK